METKPTLELFPYQKTGADFLASTKFGALYDEPGVGKTAQAIEAIKQLQIENALIICPAVARYNWVNEFEMWGAPTAKAVFKPEDISETGIQVVSYDFVARYSENLPATEVIVCDEAHYLKSKDAKRAQSILGKNGVVNKTKRFWMLTGTPIPNNISELWVILYTFGRTKLKYEEFVRHYCYVHDSAYGLKVSDNKKEMLPEIRKLIRSYSMRRTKEQAGLNLPPITYSELVVEPSEVDIGQEPHFMKWVVPKPMYEEFGQKMKKDLAMVEATMEAEGEEVTDSKRLAALANLATSLTTLRMYTGLQKVPAVAEIITEELLSKKYEKVVIFAVHQCVIEGLRRALSQFKPVTLYGKTPPEAREVNMQRFKTNPRVRVFIANIHAAGTAINLTTARDVVFIEQSFVPGDNHQAAQRCHRIPQTFPVRVRFVGLANSVDQKIARILRVKTKQISEVMDDSAKFIEEERKILIPERKFVKTISTTLPPMRDEQKSAAKQKAQMNRILRMEKKLEEELAKEETIEIEDLLS